MKKMMLEIIRDFRNILLTNQENAFSQFQKAQNRNDFNNLMFTVMNWAFWLRVDLELLLRTAYWQDLSLNEFRGRFVFDQRDLFMVTFTRIGLPKDKIEESMNEFNKIYKTKNINPIKPEKNEDILKKIVYRKDSLKRIYNVFYKILSKLSHPDPYFICFPDKYRFQIETNLSNILKKCGNELKSEWHNLEIHLKIVS